MDMNADPHIVRYNHDIDMVFSVDDGGWYGQAFGIEPTTTDEVYPTIEALRSALETEEATWS